MAKNAETASFDFATVTVADSAVPEQTRRTKENPFAAPVAALASTMTDEGRSATAKTITLPADAVAKAKRYLSLAGQDNGVSVRSIADETDDGNATVTFWTVTRIERPRKDS